MAGEDACPTDSPLAFAARLVETGLSMPGGGSPGYTAGAVMHATLPLTLVLLFGAGPDEKAPREPSPFAPSIPRLTDDEEKALDGVIDRFVLQDIGRLKGDEAKKALREFAALKSDAIPALIRGLNRTAKIEHSCPCVTIAKKLERLLLGSDDRELLQFARDEIGADVGRTRHQGVLQDLRLRVTFRMNALARQAPAAPKTSRTLTVSQLVDAANNDRGPRLKAVLLELEKRDGLEVLSGLSLAAGSYDSEIAGLGRDALDRHLGRKGEEFVRARVKDDQAEVRKSAARVVATKLPALGRDLVPLLADQNSEVRSAAHEALVKLAKGQDFGPASDANAAAREESQRQWRAWFDRDRR
jgi:hypothetical protein